ncbi:MAG: CheB methylesterase domain-containing protein [Candidatus Kariarchaeaceae archaeon]
MRIGVILVTSNPILEYEVINACKSKTNINVLAVTNNSNDLFIIIPRVNPKVIIISDDIEESPLRIIINIMETQPIPCLLANTDPGRKVDPNLTYALEYGIVDSVEIEFENEKLQFPQIIPIRVGILGKLKVQRFIGQINQINKHKTTIAKPKILKRYNGMKDHKPSNKISSILDMSTYRDRDINSKSIIVIAASTGGPRMIVDLISQFPTRFPPVFVVQHMPEGFLESFADRINTYANMTAQIAIEGEEVRSNNVYVAPGGRHLEIEKTSGGRIIMHTKRTEKVNFVRPAVDVTLKSVSPIYKQNTIAIILTGMGVDGRDGCKSVKKFGGKVMALDEVDSVIYGMNKSVIEAGLADEIVGISQVSNQLAKWVYTNNN